MGLTIDSTLQQLVDEGHNPEVCLRMKEVAIGHGLPMEVPLSAISQHVAFITRPSFIIYIDERIGAQ